MKLTLSIFFFSLLIAGSLQAQDQKTNQIMYIIDGQEVSEAYLQELAAADRIKEMRKGISDEEKALLVSKYGERVNDSFVAVITVYSDAEMKEKMASKDTAQPDTMDMEAAIKKSTLIHEGDLAPDFTVQMLDGSSVKLSDLKGKVVLLNFWATWCSPCLMEFNEIPATILKPFSGKDFVFLPISRGEKPETVKKKTEQLHAKGIEFLSGIDPETKIYTLYASEMIPRNFLIDKDGRVAFVSVGYDKGRLDEIAARIDSLLK